jgi:uncharacterized coiled-coil DUF342 family protein
MISEMTKVISVRIPMTGYMDFIKKASQNKLTVSEFLFTKLFSDEDVERDKNEIVELKAALMKSNEMTASVVNERDALNTSWIECCEKIVRIENENDTLNKELKLSKERMSSITKEHDALSEEYDDLKLTSEQLEKTTHSLEIQLQLERRRRY